MSKEKARRAEQTKPSAASADHVVDKIVPRTKSFKDGHLTQVTAGEATLDWLDADPRNANKGTGRGAEALENSLRKYGAGRSILVDKNGVVIAGNKTVAAARAAGIERVIVIPNDGKTIVAVQRADLDLVNDKEAQALAIADNRVGELSLEWDGVVLAELQRDGVDLGDLFTQDEISKLVEFEANDLLPEEHQKCPTCGQRMRE